ncbi:hypothetical protein DID77_00060 [Candidatus Marinamargulisbacteria bacterium SCGC AG-439-L15]|nr:hypothetical protein DID77_00060 [Candidatus Marinamargulisbacteria bacterium SCGC AG-439-L15]
MKLNTSLLDLYENSEQEQLILRLQRIVNQLESPPLDDLFDILDDTMDINLSGICLECLYVNRNQILPQLIQKFETSSSKKLQTTLMTLFCIKPTLELLLFIIKKYLADISLRPQIQQSVFKDKQALLLGLTYYVEESPLSPKDKTVVEELLCTIPRKEFTATQGKIAHLKIYDLYLSIDPKKRHL